MVEHLLCKQGVVGSSPIVSTEVARSHLSTTLRTTVGAPGEPPIADAYSGTPTQVNKSPSSGAASSAGISLSMKVIPDALAPSAVGEQMESAFDQAGGELCLAVLPVVDRSDVGGADHHEGRVPSEPLIKAHPVQLVSHHSRVRRCSEVRPAVDARCQPRDVVYRDEVRGIDAAQRGAHARSQ